MMKFTITVFAAVALLLTSTYAEDTWTPSPLCPYPSENLTRTPYEGDCSKYWECYEGARYPMDCAAGLQFNAETSRCDDPAVANCDPDVTIIYPTYPHSTEPTESTLPTEPTPDPGPVPDCPYPSDELTFYPVVNNCSQYWECFQGSRYLMSCPAGLYWNELASYCDYKANVDCKVNSTITASLKNTPISSKNSVNKDSAGDPDPLCPWPSHELTFYPDPSNCSRFYECYEGNRFLMSCPNSLYWNHLTSSCDYMENVDCFSSPVSCNGQADGTYLSDPQDCSKYYECVAQKAIEGKCPGDLLWNQAILSCDYATHVTCRTHDL